ncbi:MAG TPA: aldose epimerase family protein [Cryomorphaceae bacterium]|nr:aldose epimerase family protein [Cryomorphaceae bacterium]
MSQPSNQKIPDGIIRHWLKTKSGLRCEVTNYGCRIIRLLVSDRDGNFEDVVLGFDTIEEYLQPPETFFGSIVGRVANRMGGASFDLDGQKYRLTANEGRNHIHGGPTGFHSKVWRVISGDESQITLAYQSPDGEGGYPGKLEVKVVYSLTDQEGLKIAYEATTDLATPINLTNHSYFNLLGAGNGKIDGHVFQIHASRYLPNDSEQLPTGESEKVEGTVFDLREPKVISELLFQENEQLKLGEGFDNNFIPDGSGFRLIAKVWEPDSGRTMEVFTDEPGVQFFCGKAMDREVMGKDGKVYGEHSAFCLETQHFPDSINRPDFPSIVLRPGEKYRSTTVYKFGKQS